MASLTNTLQISYRIRDKDLDEDVRKEVRTVKTSTVYQRDRIVMLAAESGLIHSFAPTSGIGTLIVSPITGDLEVKLNQSGPQFGIAASGALTLQTLGAGNNTEEITSLSLYNLDSSNTLDLDIIHTD